MALPGGAATGAAQAADLTLSGALEQALRSSPSHLVRLQQVAAAEGQAVAARGGFDPVLSASASRARDSRPLRADESAVFQSAGIDPGRHQVVDTTNYRVGADQTFTNGLSAGAGFTVTSTQDRLQDLGGVPTQTAGTVSFSLTVPIGRNTGRDVLGAELDASLAEVDATRADLQHGSAQLALDTSLAYWDWVARMRSLDIAVASEQRLTELVEEMKRLILSGQTPRADLELALASRSERRAQRLAAEQAAQDSARRLARVLGWTQERLAQVGRPTDDLPPYNDPTANLRMPELVSRAIDNRADLMAARHREQAARLRLAAARGNLKPQVDLRMSVGLTGLAEDAPAWRADRSLQSPGPSAAATISMQWPWRNSAAEGAQRVAAANLDAAAIRRRDIEDGIGSSVPLAVSALRRAVAQGQEGSEAVARYEGTLRNERTKRRLGNATTIDVINVEDRLNSALLADLSIRQNHAVAIAQLLFETGALVRRNGDEYRVAVPALLGGSSITE
jgi:outer membrane protein TolC